MAWDDEAERLTLEVVAQTALDGVYAEAIDDVQRRGIEVVAVEPESFPGALLALASGPRMFAGDQVLGAYKARLRSLLAKPRLRVVPTEPNEQGGA